jgi:hypothetical protein
LDGVVLVRFYLRTILVHQTARRNMKTRSTARRKNPQAPESIN